MFFILDYYEKKYNPTIRTQFSENHLDDGEHNRFPGASLSNQKPLKFRYFAKLKNNARLPLPYDSNDEWCVQQILSMWKTVIYKAVSSLTGLIQS